MTKESLRGRIHSLNTIDIKKKIVPKCAQSDRVLKLKLYCLNRYNKFWKSIVLRHMIQYKNMFPQAIMRYKFQKLHTKRLFYLILYIYQRTMSYKSLIKIYLTTAIHCTFQKLFSIIFSLMKESSLLFSRKKS